MSNPVINPLTQLKSINYRLPKKTGLVRGSLIGKRIPIKYSARMVITPDMLNIAGQFATIPIESMVENKPLVFSTSLGLQGIIKSKSTDNFSKLSTLSITYKNEKLIVKMNNFYEFPAYVLLVACGINSFEKINNYSTDYNDDTEMLKLLNAQYDDILDKNGKIISQEEALDAIIKKSSLPLNIDLELDALDKYGKYIYMLEYLENNLLINMDKNLLTKAKYICSNLIGKIIRVQLKIDSPDDRDDIKNKKIIYDNHYTSKYSLQK